MDAIALLIDQHRKMERAFAAVSEVAEDGRAEAFARCADLLMSHVLVEERVFYPAVNAKRTEDVLLEGLEEHLSLKRLVADLLALDVGDERYGPKLHVLAEQAEHHHEEEEEKLFPKVKTLLDEDELVALGQAMAEEQAELLRDEPRRLARAQNQAASPLR